MNALVKYFFFIFYFVYLWIWNRFILRFVFLFHASHFIPFFFFSISFLLLLYMPHLFLACTRKSKRKAILINKFETSIESFASECLMNNFSKTFSSDLHFDFSWKFYTTLYHPNQCENLFYSISVWWMISFAGASFRWRNGENKNACKIMKSYRSWITLFVCQE